MPAGASPSYRTGVSASWKWRSGSRSSRVCCCSTRRRQAWRRPALRPGWFLRGGGGGGGAQAGRGFIRGAIDFFPRDLGVLISEHDRPLVFPSARRITVLANGAILADGSPQEVAANPEVRAV